MVELYGRNWTRQEALAHSGSFAQFAGVRLMTLEDGVERGVRMLEFRTGTGLSFTVMVDRGMDIGDCAYRGMAIGWNSAAGFKHPGLANIEGEDGLGWLRSFSGLLATCGLDHVLFMDDEPADHYIFDPRKTVHHSIHGRIAFLPGRLTGYGERWDGDRCTLWCEGEVAQGAVFAENLVLIRRIEVEVGTNAIRLTDRVENRGFYDTPHMVLYHFNIGHPVLDAGSRYIAPIDEVLWAVHGGDRYRAQGVGYRTMTGPLTDFHEQVWEHKIGGDGEGTTTTALVNDRLGLGVAVTWRLDQLPCLIQWAEPAGRPIHARDRADHEPHSGPWRRTRPGRVDHAQTRRDPPV